MKKYKLDKHPQYILNVIIFILTNCIVITIKYLEYIKLGDIAYVSTIIDIVVVILYIGYAATAFVILPLWFQSVCYTVTQDEIILKSGILFSHTIYVKISAIQYLTVVKAPLYNRINMNILLINAYGGRLAMLFLSYENLEEIYNRISRYLKDRGGL